MRHSGSTGPILVAAAAIVVVIAAVAGALQVRLHDAARAAAPTTSARTAAGMTCAGGACTLLESAAAGGGVAQLFATATGADGHVRFAGATGGGVFATGISAADVVLSGDSLECVAGPVPACLVSGVYADPGGREGGLAEVFVRRDGHWQRAGSMFLYSGTGSFTLVPGTTRAGPVVVAVQRDCGQATEADREGRCAGPDFVVALFAADGTSRGCTLPAKSVLLLPGQGTEPPPGYDLHECPPSAG